MSETEYKARMCFWGSWLLLGLLSPFLLIQSCGTDTTFTVKGGTTHTVGIDQSMCKASCGWVKKYQSESLMDECLANALASDEQP